jgi:hypothetical protein
MAKTSKLARNAQRKVPAHAGVHVQPQAVLLGQCTDVGDRVDHAVREAGRRPHQHHRVSIDQSLHRLHVSAQVRTHGRAPDLQIHQAGRLIEGGVQRLGCHDVEPSSGNPSLLTGPVTAGLDRLDDALGAASGHEATAGLGRLKQVQRHVHDLFLHAAHAVERTLGAQRVF